MNTETVEQFKARGGQVQRVASVYDPKPLPAYRPPKRRKRRAVAVAKPVDHNHVTIHFIAEGAGFASPASIRHPKYWCYVPERLTRKTQGGGHLYDRQQALAAIEQIKAARTMLRGGGTKAIATFARKQRDKKELAKEWTV